MFMAYNKIPQSQTFEFFEILKARSSARAFNYKLKTSKNFYDARTPDSAPIPGSLELLRYIVLCLSNFT
jgi:hypothetical protein